MATNVARKIEFVGMEDVDASGAEITQFVDVANTPKYFAPQLAADVKDWESDTGTGGVGVSVQAYAGDVVVVDANGLATSVVLPEEPSDGDKITVVDGFATATASDVTIDGNGKNINGASTFVIDADYECIQLMFSEAADRWLILSAT